MTSIPEKMKVVHLIKPLPANFREAKDFASHAQVAEIAVPVPKENEVLIKVERTPINPSDLYQMSGNVAVPALCGNEGSGVVVSAGASDQARALVGKRVAFIAYTRGGGAWAQYVTIPVPDVAEIPDDATFEEGTSAIINPWTVSAMVDIAKTGGHKSILHNVAAGAVGKMLNKFAARNGIEVINVVRKSEQKAVLEALGAKHIVVTSDEKWQSQLQELCTKLDCKLGFDGVAGDESGLLMKALRPGGTLHLYGMLSFKPASGFEAGDMLYGQKTLSTLLFSVHADKRGRDVVNKEVMARLKDDFKTGFAGTFPIDKIGDALSTYIGNMNEKVCIAPQQ